MDELVSIMQDVLSELQGINLKLDGIMGYGSDNSITDICSKLDEISSSYNLFDVCAKIGELESTITLGSNY